MINGKKYSFNDFNEEFTFFVENSSDIIQRNYVTGCLYEREELKIIQKYISHSKRVLDIGANLGNHSIFFAKVLKAQEVVVLEANPQACQLLKINIILNDLSSVINSSYLGIGISSKIEERDLSIPGNNLGGASVVKKYLNSDQIKIPLIPLDNINIPGIFELVKIDVEGMEMHVLEGMKEFTKRSRPKIFIEVANENMTSFKKWCMFYKYRVLEAVKRYEENTNFFIIPRV